MGKTRGISDGSGPHKDSWQKKNIGVGRKQQSGIPCPQKPKGDKK